MSPAAARLAGAAAPAGDRAGPDGRSRRRSRRRRTRTASSTILEYFLLAFGFVALFVGAFVIANTLGITIAQRMRELATLRTLGATRRQVYWSVVLEAFVIGVIASIIGLFLGLGLAKLLNALFVAFGIDLPQVGTVFATRTVIVALAVGIIVTLIAAIRPALRATRVEPIAAVREGALLPPSRFARFGPYIAVVVIAARARPDARRALRRQRVDEASGCSRSASARSAVFIGVAMLAPTLVPPIARVLGWPGDAFRRRRRACSPAATRSAIPSRTASTASALMIGLTLVTLVVRPRRRAQDDVRGLGQQALQRRLRAHVARTASRPRRSRPRQRSAALPGVEVVSGVRAGEGQAFGVADRRHRRRAGHHDGDRRQVDRRQRADAGAARPERRVRREELREGPRPRRSARRSSLKTPTGATLNLKLLGIFDPPKGGSPFGDVTISRSASTASTRTRRTCSRS